jgi:preprotein translocase subunit SecE
MAKRKSDKQPPTRAPATGEPPKDAPEVEEPGVEEEEREAPEGESLAVGDDLALAVREGAGEAGGDDAGEEGDAQGDTEAAQEEDGVAPAQLGTERYVLAGFFATAMLGAYILGQLVHTVWAYAANKDWFSQTLPLLASVVDDTKLTISLVIGAIISLILVVRTYRRPDIRTWSDEVASELTKVKWPTKKEVYNSTVVVIAASAIATVYLAMLDRLWGFITNLIYGDGS